MSGSNPRPIRCPRCSCSSADFVGQQRRLDPERSTRQRIVYQTPLLVYQCRDGCQTSFTVEAGS